MTTKTTTETTTPLTKKVDSSQPKNTLPASKIIDGLSLLYESNLQQIEVMRDVLSEIKNMNGTMQELSEKIDKYQMSANFSASSIEIAPPSYHPPKINLPPPPDLPPMIHGTGTGDALKINNSSAGNPKENMPVVTGASFQAPGTLSPAEAGRILREKAAKKQQPPIQQIPKSASGQGVHARQATPIPGIKSVGEISGIDMPWLGEGYPDA